MDGWADTRRQVGYDVWMVRCVVSDAVAAVAAASRAASGAGSASAAAGEDTLVRVKLRHRAQRGREAPSDLCVAYAPLLPACVDSCVCVCVRLCYRSMARRGR